MKNSRVSKMSRFLAEAQKVGEQKDFFGVVFQKSICFGSFEFSLIPRLLMPFASFRNQVKLILLKHQTVTKTMSLTVIQE